MPRECSSKTHVLLSCHWQILSVRCPFNACTIETYMDCFGLFGGGAFDHMAFIQDNAMPMDLFQWRNVTMSTLFLGL